MEDWPPSHVALAMMVYLADWAPAGMMTVTGTDVSSPSRVSANDASLLDGAMLQPSGISSSIFPATAALVLFLTLTVKVRSAGKPLAATMPTPGLTCSATAGTTPTWGLAAMVTGTALPFTV
ncbi:MAG: hypothetical protein BWY85_01319 [Firmicutes bacterium ADurb.Bin506]|nr:MAG: hypothetical protein BWY85_01319 [Firmicutes bacterium ADurb.Bin506]